MTYSAADVDAMIAASQARVEELVRRLARERWSVLDYQHRIGQRVFGPGCQRRDDLAPIAAVWERVYQSACGEGPPVIALVSAPPQIGKTMLGQYAVARHITRQPSHRVALVTYGQDLANEKSREIRDIVRSAGVQLRDDSKAVDSWSTVQGGGLLARGRDGGMTGQSGLKAIWVCDPYKNRLEAESATISQRIADQLSATVMTRRHPETSVVVEHTRWATTDVIARLRDKLEPLRSSGVDVIEVNLPSIDLATGKPLITFGGRDAAYYAAQRELVSEHDWWALYMGQPRAREGRLFRGAHLYDARPDRYAVAIGMDMAYTASKSADWSAAVVLARDLTTTGAHPVFYVLDVERARCTVAEWASRMHALRTRYGGASIYMRTGGQEAALLDTMRVAHGLVVHHEPTRGDKRQNALVVSDDWNAGRVLLPSAETTWAEGFLSRVLDFSGEAGGEVDDEIDALVTAHRALTQGSAAMMEGGPVAVPAGRLPAARGGWL